VYTHAHAIGLAETGEVVPFQLSFPDMEKELTDGGGKPFPTEEVCVCVCVCVCVKRERERERERGNVYLSSIKISVLCMYVCSMYSCIGKYEIHGASCRHNTIRMYSVARSLLPFFTTAQSVVMIGTEQAIVKLADVDT
jgi:hypothetical protein